MHGFPPALTNAICDAIGIRPSELPVTPDRLLDAIQARRREQKLQARRAVVAAAAPAPVAAPAATTEAT